MRLVSEPPPLAADLEAAASALEADSQLAHPSLPQSSLLSYLGYDDRNAAKARGRARMLRAAAKFRRIFLLPVPDAPGIVFFGGEADPAVLGTAHAGQPLGNLAGSGLSPQRAFESCVGEGVEYLSQFVRADDPIELGSLADHGSAHDAETRRFLSAVLEVGKVDPRRGIAWMPARRLPDGAEIWFPVDLCCRRPATHQDFTPPLKLSTGCAAIGQHGRLTKSHEHSASAP